MSLASLWGRPLGRPGEYKGMDWIVCALARANSQDCFQIKEYGELKTGTLVIRNHRISAEFSCHVTLYPDPNAYLTVRDVSMTLTSISEN